MNPGLAIFKKRQRFQGGTENLEPGPLPYDKIQHGFKTRAGIYDPGPGAPRSQDDDEQGHTAVDPATEEQLRGVYGTIGINVDGEEHEVPLWHKDMTAEEAEEAARMRWEWDLNAFAPDSELEKVQNAAHQGPDDASALPPPTPEEARKRAMNEHARGTSNVQHFQEGVNNLDYDPSYPGPTNPRESGSGYLTQRGAGLVGSVGGNFIFPGLGLLTGPLASWATRMIQAGMSQNAVQRAVQDYQQNQGGGTTGGGTTDDSGDNSGGGTTTTAPRTPSAGVGIDPMGNPAKPGEWWSNDFGRWNTDKYGTTPGNYWNQSGPGGPPGTRGLGGNFGIGGPGSATVPGTYQVGNLGGDAVVDASALGNGGMARNLMAKLAKGIGIEANNPALMPSPGFQIAGSVGPGSGQGDIINPNALGGASSANQSVHFRPRAEAQKGDSDIGLRIFKHHQKLQGGSSGIHINPANKGKFTALQRETGKSTAELKNSPNPLTRQRANFALMARRHWKPL